MIEPPQGLPIVREVIHRNFALGDVQPQPDGTRVLPLIIPNGDVLVFILTEENAKRLGKALTAPSLRIASAGEVPL